MSMRTGMGICRTSKWTIRHWNYHAFYSKELKEKKEVEVKEDEKKTDNGDAPANGTVSWRRVGNHQQQPHGLCLSSPPHAGVAAPASPSCSAALSALFGFSNGTDVSEPVWEPLCWFPCLSWKLIPWGVMGASHVSFFKSAPWGLQTCNTVGEFILIFLGLVLVAFIIIPNYLNNKKLW